MANGGKDALTLLTERMLLQEIELIIERLQKMFNKTNYDIRQRNNLNLN